MREDGPLWTLDLRSFGYGGYRLPREFPSHSVLNPITFSSDNTLIASFLTQEAVRTVPHRNEASADLPLKLQAIFLAASGGRFQAKRAWSTPHPVSVDIVATHDGQFIVALRDRLTLYSRDLKPLRESTLATPAGPQGDILTVEVSPQGKSLLLVYLRGKQRINWINADNLDLVRAWAGPQIPSGVSDDEVAVHEDTYVKSRGFLVEVVLRNRRGISRTVCRAWSGCGIPQFVSKEALVLYGPHEITLIDTSGKGLFTQHLADNDWITDWRSPFRPSANGDRFAIAIWAHRGGSDILDMTAHSVLKRIMVFDIPSRRWIYTLDAKKQNIKTITGLALSPDGSLLALIDQDGILQVYRLPPESSDEIPAPPH